MQHAFYIAVALLCLGLFTVSASAKTCEAHFAQSVEPPKVVLEKTGRPYVLEHLYFRREHHGGTRATLTDCAWGVSVDFNHIDDVTKQVKLRQVERIIARYNRSNKSDRDVYWGLQNQYRKRKPPLSGLGAWSGSGALRNDLTTCACAAFFPDVAAGKTPVETLR